MQFPRFLRRLRGLLHRRDMESAMDAEMQYHLDCETEDRVAMGMSRDEARRAARRDFGGVDRHKETARDERGFRWLHELRQDTRHALRTLQRNPGYTAGTLLTFALGIGFATAIFSVVNGVLLRPLPFARPDRLVVLWERNAARSVETNVVSVPNFEAWRDRSHAFSGLAALVPDPVTLSGDDPERVMGADVSPGFFHLLGVAPAVGREFVDDDARAGAQSVVILSDGLWRRRFGADRAIVGRTILLSGTTVTVVGVMPPGFDPPKFGWLGEHQLWLPFAATADNRGWGRFLLVLARLRDDGSVESATADLVSIAAQRAAADPSNAGWSASVVPLSRQITGDVRRPLLILLGAGVLLLAMAATNVASLMLGFMRRRDAELAMRQALGASRGRILRQLVTHAVVLGVIASAAGVLAAFAGTRALKSLMPADVPRAAGVRIDGRVLLFATAVGLAVSLACGIAVAFQRRDSAALTRAAASRSTRSAARGSLVASEMALGIVLTVLAGLMIRTFANLRAVNLGFDAGNVIAARVSLPSTSYGSRERQIAFFDVLGERLHALPGVEGSSFVTSRPFSCCAPATVVSNTPPADKPDSPTTDVRFVDSAYFPTLRVPVIAGHGFESVEPARGRPSAVISQQLARALWRGTDPLNRTIYVALGDWETNAPVVAQVVGVVGDVHLVDPRTEPRATLYLSTTRFPSTVRDVVMRTSGDPDATVASLRSVVRSIDPGLALYEVTTMRDAVDRTLARDRFTMAILLAFSVVSLLLTAVGVYAVFAAEVTSRRKEIGVRLALGAGTSGVVSLVMGRAMRLAATGAAIGVVVGLAVARSMSGLVYGVSAADPLSFVAVTTLLLAVAALATLVPALGATRASPLEAIRADQGVFR